MNFERVLPAWLALSDLGNARAWLFRVARNAESCRREVAPAQSPPEIA